MQKNPLQLIYYFISLVSVLSVTGCEDSSKLKPPPGNSQNARPLPNGQELPSVGGIRPEFIFSTKKFLNETDVSEEDIDKRAKATIDLYFSIVDVLDPAYHSSNFTLSPLSIQTSFGILFGATKNQSKSGNELAKAFQFSDERDTTYEILHGHLRAVQKAFDSTKKNDVLDFVSINQLWIEEQYGVQETFSNNLKRYFNAGVAVMPFQTKPQASLDFINSFISHNTYGFIDQLLPDDALDDDLKLLLTNASLLQADWDQPFPTKNTNTKIFFDINGNEKKVKMMLQSGTFDFGETPEIKAISLDLANKKSAILFVTPKSPENYKSFFKTFKKETFLNCIAALTPKQVTIGLPRVSINWSGELEPALKSLGMSQVFTPNQENFPRLLTKDDSAVKVRSQIDGVYQQTRVELSEGGINLSEEDSDSSIKGDKAEENPQNSFIADHPVLFFIYEKEYKTIVFGGQIAEIKSNKK